MNERGSVNIEEPPNKQILPSLAELLHWQQRITVISGTEIRDELQHCRHGFDQWKQHFLQEAIKFQSSGSTTLKPLVLSSQQLAQQMLEEIQKIDAYISLNEKNNDA